MQIICPFCKSVYDGFGKDIKNVKVECAECKRTFEADPIEFTCPKKITKRVRNVNLIKLPEGDSKINNIEKSNLPSVLRFLGFIPLIVGVLLLFIGLCSASSSGASERTESIIPWIFGCFKWAIIISICSFTVARIIELLEYACQMLYSINKKNK